MIGMYFFFFCFCTGASSSEKHFGRGIMRWRARYQSTGETMHSGCTWVIKMTWDPLFQCQRSCQEATTLKKNLISIYRIPPFLAMSQAHARTWRSLHLHHIIKSHHLILYLHIHCTSSGNAIHLCHTSTSVFLLTVKGNPKFMNAGYVFFCIARPTMRSTDKHLVTVA